MTAPHVSERLCEADFDLLDAPEYLFTDLWGNGVPDRTRLKLAHDGDTLYFLFRSEFEGVLPEKYKKKSGKVFRADATEIFVCFDGNTSRYYELDLSPFNRAFFAVIENPDDQNLSLARIGRDVAVTATRMCDGYYDTLYALPISRFSPSGNPDILFNAYRVRVIDGKRTSRALCPTQAVSHHVRESFVKLLLK